MTFYSGDEEIIIPSIEKKGTGFELWHDEIQWDELYRAEKKFFSYRWINSDQERNAWKIRADAFDRCQSMMRKYLNPPFIIGEEKTVIIKDETLSTPRSMYDHASRTLKTTYRLTVTNELAADIFNQYDKSRIVVIGNQPDISNAKVFYKKALAADPEALKILFENGAKKYHSLTINSFCYGNNDSTGFPLYKAGLNPLGSIEEVLGFAMAICDKNQDQIPNEQIWYLCIDHARQSVSISKRNFSN